jgi:hypothetical protein
MQFPPLCSLPSGPILPSVVTIMGSNSKLSFSVVDDPNLLRTGPVVD